MELPAYIVQTTSSRTQSLAENKCWNNMENDEHAFSAALPVSLAESLGSEASRVLPVAAWPVLGSPKHCLQERGFET